MNYSPKHNLDVSAKVIFRVVAVCALILSLVCVSQNLMLTSNSDLISNSNRIDSSTNCTRHAEPPAGWYSPITDADKDHMDDIWENRYTFSSSDPGDAYFDADQDGFTNVEEFEAGTHPGSDRSYPGVLHVRSMDFNCFYTVEMGLINDDDLLDILIRDPDERYFPYIPDFVMIQQSDQSFFLDYAIRYKFDGLISISSVLILADLNANVLKDIALVGLSDYIPGVEDQFIFSSTGAIRYKGVLGVSDTFPLRHVALGPREVSFFSELHRWARTYYLEDYFDSNAPVISSVPELTSLNWITDSSGAVKGSYEPLAQESFPIECASAYSRCLTIVADENDALNLTALESLVIEYLPIEFELVVTDSANNSNEDDLYFQVKADFDESSTVELKDYSIFNQDALSLARNQLRSILESGVMFYPSDEANAIYNMLSDYLGGTRVFANSYFIPRWGTYYMDFEHTSVRNIVGRVQGVLLFVGNRYVRSEID